MTPNGVSVLITTHNYGRFIEEAIDSVLSQQVPSESVQIVVVDDGSTDDTSERVKQYSPRVEYFYKPNGGQASALNFGFARARGEIISLLDADDVFLPGKLARVVEAFKQSPALGMVYHPYQQWNLRKNERTDSNFPLISGDIHQAPNQFFFYWPHPTSCISFRRAFVNRLLPIPENIQMAADAYPVTLIPFVSPVAALHEPLVVYRIHGMNSLPYFDNAYQTHEDHMPIETRRRRLQMYGVLIDAMRKWLKENGFGRDQPSVGALLDRWNLFLESEQFKLVPPARFTFFRHLILYSRCFGPHISGRLRVLSYFNAVGALFTGYRHFHLLDDLRQKASSLVRGVRAESSK